MQPIALARNWARTHPLMEAEIWIHRWGTRRTVTTAYLAANGKIVRETHQSQFASDGRFGTCQACGHIFTDPVLRLAWAPDPNVGEVPDPADFPHHVWPWLRWHTHAYATACPGCIQREGLEFRSGEFQHIGWQGKLCIVTRAHPAIARFNLPPRLVEIDLRGSLQIIEYPRDQIPWAIAQTM